MTKRRRWILLSLAALAAILLVLFDWNWLKGPVESAASAALGREVEIAGELDVDFSATPAIALEQVRIANAAWGSRPHMLTMPRVDLAVRLWRLLRGRIELPYLRVQEPDLLLEINREGEGNWQFGPPDEPGGAPTIPMIGDLQIAGAAIRYHEPGRAQDLVAALDAVAGAITGSGIRLSADGSLNQEPLALRLASAPAERLEPAAEAERFPFELDARLGSTRFAATGSAERPLEAQGLSVEIEVRSETPGALLALAGREPQNVGPFQLSMVVTRQDDVLGLQGIAARLGESDLRGSATVQLGGTEPVVSAELASDQVRLEDLKAVIPGIGARAGEVAPDAALDAAIADARSALEEDEQAATASFGLDPGMLPRIDGELRYALARLTGPELALADLDVYARLAEGLPRLEVTGGGRYRDMPVALDVRLGRTAPTGSDDGAYPVQARIEAAGTQVQLEGAIGRPETLDALDLQVAANSDNITELLAFAALELPQIPPFAITGHLARDGQVWRVSDFYGQFSESELAGAVTIDLSEGRPFVTADLTSGRLLVSDLVTAGDRAAVVEEEVVEEAAEATGAGGDDRAEDAAAGDDAAETAAADGETESEAEEADASEVALISVEGVDLEALPEIDADVAFEGQAVEYGELRFDQLSFDLKLRDRSAVLDASGQGRYREGPLSLEAHLGSEETLENPDARYPIAVQIASEETRVTVEGTSAAPARLAGLDVDVALAGPDLNRVGEILQLPLPATPPFEVRGHLTHEENRWNLAKLNGTVGDSDIQGNAAIVLGGARPLLEAQLTSNALDFDDLGLLVGAPPDTDETASEEQERAAAEAAAEDSLLPDEPFDVPKLRAVDAKVSFEAKQVQAQKLPLEGMAVDLTLEDGRLTLEPLRFEVAGGTFDSMIRLDAQGDALVGVLELDVRDLRLNELLAQFEIEIAQIETEQEGVGAFSGRGKLAVRGNSVAELAGSAEGQVAIIMRGGQLNALILEGIGLDVGEAVALLLTGDEEAQSEMVPVRCFVGDFALRDGVMRAEALVLDTADSTITGKGQIDLGAESLALEFVAHPKDASVLTASTPVRIEGTFKEPKIDVVSEELEEKSLAALALGVILPVLGAILPFVEEGDAEDKDCGRLIEAAVASVERASPSPPAN